MSHKVIRHLCADTTSRFIIATIKVLWSAGCACGHQRHFLVQI